MNSRDIQVLRKLDDEIRIIDELLGSMTYEVFEEDDKTQRAVCMTLINIGELVKMLTDELKQMHSDIPWRAISGLRDVTAHRYQTLRMEDIWATIHDGMCDLKKKVAELIR